MPMMSLGSLASWVRSLMQMSVRSKLITAVAVAAAGCASSPTFSPRGLPASGPAVVVRFQGGVTAAQRTALRDNYKASSLPGRLPGLELWRLPAGANVGSAVTALKASCLVRYASVDGTEHVSSLASPGLDTGSGGQWNLQAIQAPEAWAQDFSPTDPPGKGVVVAIVDSGIDVRHPDLAPNIARDASGDVVFYDEIAAEGQHDVACGPNYDWSTAYSDAAHPGPDGNGHGTHVAGIVAGAGATASAGVPVYGVAPAATLLPVKVMDCQGNGDDWAIANGIIDAANYGARVINLSIGGPQQPKPVLEDAITYAEGKGDLLVAAAGNDYSPNTVDFPAADFGVLAVASIGVDGTHPAYSDVGPQVAIAAPGGNLPFETAGVLSTLPTYPSQAGAEDGGRTLEGHLAGTSQATPQVAGVAALLWSRDPNLEASQVRSRLLASAGSGQSGPSETEGFGMVNAAKALALGSEDYSQ